MPVESIEEQWKDAVPAIPVTITPALPDRYEILNLVGQGGTGSVFKVHDTGSGRTLAVKVLRPELVDDESALKRFEQEAQSVARLEHPNLVTIYGHELDKEGRPYIVMDFLEGESLAEVLKAEGAMDTERAARVFSKVCRALHYAHLRGIVHRDLKPGNIILSVGDSEDEAVHIVDFGIAKVLTPQGVGAAAMTQTGEIFGSPKYMSPEQCQGLELTLQSDIYSLGCVLYESMCGKPPFDGDNPVKILLKHLREELRIGSEFEPAFAQIIRNCMEKLPGDRYRTAEDLERDLENAARGFVVRKTRARHYISLGSIKILFSAFVLGILVAVATANWSYCISFVILGLGIAFISNFYNLQMDIEIAPDTADPADRWLCLLYLVVAFSTVPVFLWICLSYDSNFYRKLYLSPEVIKLLPFVVASCISFSLAFFCAWMLRRRENW